MERRWIGLVSPLLVLTVGLANGVGAFGAAAKKKPMAKAKGGAGAIAQGKGFVQADRCTGCHKIAGKGGATGPDLSSVGARRNATEIAAKIKNPKASNPNSIMPPSRRSDKQLAAMAAYLASLK
jgi:mono/diheme cytochrome c family protein